MSTLKPCPFCGSENIYVTYIGSGDWEYECGGCEIAATIYIRAPEKERDLADMKWNTRAQEPKP